MEDIIYGRNSIMELLTSTNRTINKLLVVKGDTQGSIKKIISLAHERHIVITETTKQKLDELAVGGNHQGIIAFTTPYKYFEIDDILNSANEKNEKPFVLILDGIEDPHNLGAIIRTAECMGVHGIIIPKRRAAVINSTVMKVAAGALEHMMVARVTNINDTIEELKEKGLWIIGTDASGRDSIQNVDMTSPIAIVIGSEGEGMSNLTRKRCDILAKIDMKGQITSLNASVSAGMIVYEVTRQRNI